MIDIIENHIPDVGKKVNKIECDHIYGWDERYNCPVMQPESKYDLLAEPLKEGVEEIKRHMVFFNYCPNCGKELKK